MDYKNSRSSGMTAWALVLVLSMGWCAPASQAWAQPFKDPKAALAASAREAIEGAAELADLLDTSKEDLGPQPEIGPTLSRARASAPRRPEGFSEWRSGRSGLVRAWVEDPALCRELMSQCQAKAASPSDPGRCACSPAISGGLEFVFRIRVPDPADPPVK